MPLVNISVVEGKSAELPCDITPPGEDTLHMVFWFRDEAGVPLYTWVPQSCFILDRTCLKKEKKEEEEKSSEINFGTGMRYKRRFGLLFPVLYIPYHEIQAALLNVRHCSSATRPTPKFLSAFRFADCSLELAAITPPRGLFAPSQLPPPFFSPPPKRNFTSLR